MEESNDSTQDLWLHNRGLKIIQKDNLEIEELQEYNNEPC